jgi:sodium/hydrogen exchanger 10/11
MLQSEHPGIAISVKTRQAIRTVLNNARDVSSELRGGGLLDEAEYSKLESVTIKKQCITDSSCAVSPKMSIGCTTTMLLL